MESGYFHQLSAALRQAGYFRPALVIDRDRLDRNIARLLKGLGPQTRLRIVDKSLPSLGLIRHVLEATGARAIMTFHLPITRAVLEAFPGVDALFGKPMPVEAAEQFLTGLDAAARLSAAGRITWLIDTAERLDAYAALASRLLITLNIAFEVDIGVRRGGVQTPEELSLLLDRARRQAGIAVRGLMGYEAHIPAMPALAGGPGAEQARVIRRFQSFVDCLRQDERAILNTGGSKTALIYGSGHAANELSTGSALLLPSDFDTPALKDFEPAAFIATPALKVGPARLPGPDFLPRLLQAFGRFPRRACYIYGGAWMARPVFPEGLRENALWGRSSNQQFLGMDDRTELNPGDTVFLRPTQSEAVLQQFGPIAVYSEGRIVEEWLPVPPG